MFEKENVGLIGAEEKKERKKVIKMKDVFVIPDHLKHKYHKKEKHIKPKEPTAKSQTRMTDLKKTIHQPQSVADKNVSDNSKKMNNMDSQMQNSIKRKMRATTIL
jgi:hypothetical protein